MVADDLDLRDLGAYGRLGGLTPSIDSIGDKGVVFTNAHAASPLSAPSRFALLTGGRARERKARARTLSDACL
eukprot:632648-Pleurochrysis_carterae.AAC.1